jgi:hypothetical protein
MSKSSLRIIAIFGFVVLCFSANGQSTESAKKEEQIACIACHSLRLIHSQRLSTAAWGKEVDKMVGWGATVPDRQLLIDYLAAQYSDTKPVPVPSASGNGVISNSR